MNIYLASGSPRRRELLTQIGVPFCVVASGYAEADHAGFTSVAAMVEYNAVGKACGALPLLKPGICIGADTVVALEGRVMGKPRCAADAVAMLLTLSGKTHEVVSGIALVDHLGESVVGHTTTRVTFRELSIGEIEAYVENGEPLDKAGAYAIQGRGALFVQNISGCYSNVVGLPINLLVSLFSRGFAINLTDMWR